MNELVAEVRRCYTAGIRSLLEWEKRGRRSESILYSLREIRHQLPHKDLIVETNVGNIRISLEQSHRPGDVGYLCSLGIGHNEIRFVGMLEDLNGGDVLDPVVVIEALGIAEDARIWTVEAAP